ncbi:class I SAM-dependent methyltransferase [Saccharothrix texasensis]|uniref:Methyltransferase family protein n=1 Tax=Saccharothrix texasensis TaxID=103734 RepID=A0A3N1H9P3_9PSEU|nr:class I SAM-dependent methyltransferase [Saccharothrix texasensis]ROP39161.1 methyltransferase family protein [Saccharothrix texasensis]
MLDKVRHSPIVDEVRKRVRGKILRVIDEAVRPYHREQAERIAVLQQELQELRRQADRAVDATVQYEIRARRDLVFAGEQEAAKESARFIRRHLPTAPHFGHPHATLEHALGLVSAEGMALEFGVYTGGTLKLIATAFEGRDVYGFDSFEGLPEDWRNGFPAGLFGMDGLPDVDGAELVVGWFDDTLPGFLDEHPGPVSFLHVDCDLYSSTKTVLELVGPRLVPGSVIVFDEYFNYPGWQDHEHKAWSEYVDRTGIEFDYCGYTYDHEQVIMKVTGVPEASQQR